MSQNPDRDLLSILNIIKDARGLDFTGYRPALLLRRIMVRVRATRQNVLSSYIAHLKKDPEEVKLLVSELTINVTEFFRDEHVFDLFENKILPELISKKKMCADRTLSIWSNACATGEEACSILMCLAEVLQEDFPKWRVKILGTDIDDDALKFAKAGIYSTRNLTKLSARRSNILRKYFCEKTADSISIKPAWEGLITFSTLDSILDEYPKAMDVVFCRNMLMYIDRPTQDKILSKIKDSISEGGFLILGAVESILGESKKQFIEYDGRCRAYKKIATV